jgi:hypothetical protein
MPVRALGAVLVGVLAGACSLPLSREVREVGEITGEQRPGGSLAVIPPGPREGATPVETVLGFLGAQASSAGRHEIARLFLTGSARESWDDTAEVQVYDPDRLELAALPDADPARRVVRVTARLSGVVHNDGSYEVQDGTRVVEDYTLERAGGQWRLREVPSGLRLTRADLLRAFSAYPVYYLASTAAEDDPHLVPDLVFLPTGGDVATALVQRLLVPPSQALAGSVQSAVPSGARLRTAVSLSNGTATVDLTAKAVPSGRAAQDLSAQLVWTLRSLGSSFRGLRLLFEGTPLEVGDTTGTQDANRFASYDPEGLAPDPPYLYTSGRRLRASIELPASPATAGDVGDGAAVPVDVAALTPDQTSVALLDNADPRNVLVRVGPLKGTSFPVVAKGSGLTSPTWGSGHDGLWMLRSGTDVVRVAGALRKVPVEGRPAGRLGSVALSRDGVRVALVAGGRLYIGRVEGWAGGPRIVGLASILPGVSAVVQVAWASSTELLVLGTRTRTAQLVRVSVDGSSVATLNTAGLTPSAIAAAPTGVVLVSDDDLYLSSTGGFRLVQTDDSRAPAFPG